MLTITALDPELTMTLSNPPRFVPVPVVTVTETANVSGATIDHLELRTMTGRNNFEVIDGGSECLRPGNPVAAGSTRRISIDWNCFYGSGVSVGMTSDVSIRYHDDAGVSGTATASLFMPPLS